MFIFKYHYPGSKLITQSMPLNGTSKKKKKRWFNTYITKVITEVKSSPSGWSVIVLVLVLLLLFFLVLFLLLDPASAVLDPPSWGQPKRFPNIAIPEGSHGHIFHTAKEVEPTSRLLAHLLNWAIHPHQPKHRGFGCVCVCGGWWWRRRWE